MQKRCAEHTCKSTHTHTHINTHVKTCHFHTAAAAAAAAAVFWWQIRFCSNERQPVDKRGESSESSLVTVEQPRHHLHLAIWMSSGSVAGYCTSLNSSSRDNSRWQSQIKPRPTQRILWIAARRPDHSNTHKAQLKKLGYKRGGFTLSVATEDKPNYLEHLV